MWLPRWPPGEHIKEIADLKHPIRSFRPPDNLDRKDLQDWRLQRNIESKTNEQYKNDLIAACEGGLLKYEGNIKGETYWAKRSFFIPDLDPNELVKHTRGPECCKIHKNEFKRYLQSESVKQWPVDGLLANWWADNEEPEQTDTPTPYERPQLKETVPQIGEIFRNRSYRDDRQRRKAYFGYIWMQYGDKPEPEDFLNRLRDDGFVNPLDKPNYDRELAPIYKIDIRKGIWFTYDELTEPKINPEYTRKAVKNNCGTEWKSESKKGKKASESE